MACASGTEIVGIDVLGAQSCAQAFKAALAELAHALLGDPVFGPKPLQR